MDLSGDDHLERAVTELGEPEALFRISKGRFLAKLALGVSFIIAGAVANYLWWFRGPAQINHFVFHLLYLVPLTGAALLVHMYRHRGLFVLIYPTGLLRLRRGEVDSFPWREVDHVRLRVARADGAEFARDDNGITLACWLPADTPTFKLGDAGVTLARADGVEAHLGPALSDYVALAEEVQKRTFAVLWPAVRARFRARGPHRVRRSGSRCLSVCGTTAACSRSREVKELAVARDKLSVKQAGKWLPWAAVDLGQRAQPAPLVRGWPTRPRRPFSLH